MSLQLGTVDGLINITDEKIRCFVNAIHSFNNECIEVAKENNISFGKAFQRYVEPVYNNTTNSFSVDSMIQPVYTRSGNEQSPARVTFCKKMGLLNIDESNNVFKLTDLGAAVYGKSITISEYAFILLSKQGIFIDGEYSGNLLVFFAEQFTTNSVINESSIKEAAIRQFGDDEIIKTRIDIILNAFVAADILKSIATNTYVLADITSAKILDVFILNSKSLSPAVKDDDDTYIDYIGSFNNGVFDVFNSSNAKILESKFPNLYKSLSLKNPNNSLNNNLDINMVNQPLQVIYYGAPGTGKSFEIQKAIKEYGNDKAVRTTFHPDSDYSSFVGTYKPTMSDVRITTFNGTMPLYADSHDKHPGTERKIVYKFVPQAFLKAYVDAWKDLGNPHFLIIEEINRGNCAQIFGDLFQLLDRNSQGCSSYATHADEDIHQFLKNDDKGFKSLSADQREAIEGFVHIEDNGSREHIGEQIADGELLLLPPNLHIWATMNTSDQSLFPIDSAFKRRWNWEYMPIEYDKKNWLFEVNGKRYRWGDFLRAINPIIYELTDSSDKQMGYFFAKPDKKSDPSLEENDIISEKIFLNKVLFYLWTDVLKDYDVSDEPFIVKNSDPQRTYIFTDFFDKENSYLEEFITKEKLALTKVDEVVSDMDGDKKISNGVNARVDGSKCWTITQTLYHTLRSIAPEMTYEQITVLLTKYLAREADDIIKTIPSADGYVKENGWFDYKPLQTVDGQTFVITNQWKKDYIPLIKKFASDMNVEYIDYNENTPSSEINGQGGKTLDRYSLNGEGSYFMGPVVTEAMNLYISKNPELTAQEIVSNWSDFRYPKVYLSQQFDAKKAVSKDARIDKKHAKFDLSNGETIYISIGFVPETIAEFIRILDSKDWGITIRKID